MSLALLVSRLGTSKIPPFQHALLHRRKVVSSRLNCVLQLCLPYLQHLDMQLSKAEFFSTRHFCRAYYAVPSRIWVNACSNGGHELVL